MIGYKIMRKRNHISGQAIRTSEFNYGNRTNASREDYVLQSMLVRAAHDTGIPFGALTVFAMQAQCGEVDQRLVELLKRED